MRSALHERGHGNAYRYDQGCRCDECREAKRLTRRAARDRARAENRPSYRRELAASLRLKRFVYSGTCEQCGASTTGCGGPGTAPKVCRDCAPGVYGPIFRQQRLGKGKNIEALLAFLDGGARRYTEIRDHLGVSSGHASVLLHRHVQSGLIVRVARGVYAKAENSHSGADE